MSRVFEALRNAEQENRATTQAFQEGGNKSNEHARLLPGEPTVEKSSDVLKEEQKAPASVKQELGVLAVRLEASRGYLEALIVDARRVRESLETELGRASQRIQESGLDALRAVAATVKAEFLEEIEAASQSAVSRVQRRVAERTGEALDSLVRAAEARLGTVTAECLDRFRQSLDTMAREHEEETSTRLQKTAGSALESVADLFQKSTHDSLSMFSEALVSSGKGFIEESRKTIEQFAETACRALKAELERELQKQQDLALPQVQKDPGDLESDAPAVSRTASGGPTEQMHDEVRRQVGQAITALTEWQNHARANLESNFEQSMQAFVKQVNNLSAEIAEQHRETVRRLLSDLERRLARAAKTSKEEPASDSTSNGETTNE